MPLTFFTAIADFKAIIAQPPLSQLADPFIQTITGIIVFTPSVTQVFSELDERIYRIEPLLARIDNGVLKLVSGLALDENIPAAPIGEPDDHRRFGVRLTANTDALGPLETLDYTVKFSKVVFNKQDQRLPAFTFPAPTDDMTIDLATVHRRTKTRI